MGPPRGLLDWRCQTSDTSGARSQSRTARHISALAYPVGNPPQMTSALGRDADPGTAGVACRRGVNDPGRYVLVG